MTPQMNSETAFYSFRRQKGSNGPQFFLGPYSSGGGNKWFEVGRYLGRGKPIELGFVTNSLELLFLDGQIDDKSEDTIQQTL